jgi:hypothetical protein
MQCKIRELKGEYSDLKINIPQPDVGLMGFSKKSVEKSINYGYSAMKKSVPKLKKLLQD